MTSDLHIKELSNGIIVCHRQVNNTKIAHCGITFDIGSRDEQAHEMGLAHFWEHMAFKGTRDRTSFEIIDRIESVGGDLNAYTSKEKVYLYTSVLENYFDRAAELLVDITFGSTFPETEIEKEKGVILEEMSMYEDSPEDSIFDDFDSVIYPNHTLGKNILGTRESVKTFKQEDFFNFLKNNMGHKQVVFSSVSSLPFDKVLNSLEKYLGDISIETVERTRIKPGNHTVLHKEVSKPIQQSHVLMGVRAPEILNPDRIPFFMLSYLLGGPIMSSRLNLNLREKHGLVYSVESNFNSFSDTGNFNIYFGTDKQHVEKSKSLIFKEVKRFREEALSSVQMSKLQNQICGNLAMAEESNSSFMQMMGKSIHDVGQIETLTDVFGQIRGVTTNQIMDVANQYLNEDLFSSLTYLSEN